MKLTKKQSRMIRNLVAAHDGIFDELSTFAGVAREDRSLAYPVESRGRVAWFKQVCAVSAPRESGRRYHYPAVVRVRRPANAVAVLRALQS